MLICHIRVLCLAAGLPSPGFAALGFGPRLAFVIVLRDYFLSPDAFITERGSGFPCEL